LQDDTGGSPGKTPNSTISITACNELYFAESLLPGTLCVVRDFKALYFPFTD
jgi:hypothetical protein